jgi:hypothetical protein
MESLSTLSMLKELIEEHKKKSLQLLISESSKRITSANCDIILNMVEELKDIEKEKSRLDWKAGYIECTINLGEFFGNKREDSFPNDDELEVINKLSHNFITKNNI